jgi:hypothetical protein
METFFSSAARGNVRRITQDVKNGVMVFMPGYQMFQDIRFHIATFSGSHGGVRLKEAYDKEGYPFYPLQSVTEARQSIVPCIKRIYQMSEWDPNKINIDGSRGMFVDKTPGEWIYTEACNCVSEAAPQYTNDRMNIGDGFVVPGIQEQTDISALVTQKGYTFNQAMTEICPDIIPPTVSCIENGLVNHPTWQWYDIYSACRTAYLKDQGITPLPNGNGEKSNNTLIYVLIGVGVLLLLSRKA